MPGRILPALAIALAARAMMRAQVSAGGETRRAERTRIAKWSPPPFRPHLPQESRHARLGNPELTLPDRCACSSRSTGGRANVIVEYGPGVGTITGEILKRMRADAKLIIIEMNREFVRFLREAFNDAPARRGGWLRPRMFAASSQRMDSSNAEYIISGIPLGSMPAPVREQIVRETK